MARGTAVKRKIFSEKRCDINLKDSEAGLGFNKFDVNGNGKISPSELDAIMGSLVHLTTEDELRSMILEVYADGNRFIDINEVMELNTNGINWAETMQNLKDAFSVYDIDGNGSISVAELSAVPSHSS
ncbi:PREDICTED: probable calcium-binding protein CML25-like [Fragaria vesca subsp. vesca]